MCVSINHEVEHARTYEHAEFYVVLKLVVSVARVDTPHVIFSKTVTEQHPPGCCLEDPSVGQ